MVRAGRAPQPRSAPHRSAPRPAAARRDAMRSRRRHARGHAHPATPTEATPPRVVTSGRATIWEAGGVGAVYEHWVDLAAGLGSRPS